jgi:hypothetical protein
MSNVTTATGTAPVGMTICANDYYASIPQASSHLALVTYKQ